MRNTFMGSAREALVSLLAAQAKHERLKARADRRLEAAKAVHAAEIVRAARLEADAWHALLAVPGVTTATAAALLEVSEATVVKWARVPKTVKAGVGLPAKSGVQATGPIEERIGEME